MSGSSRKDKLNIHSLCNNSDQEVYQTPQKFDVNDKIVDDAARQTPTFAAPASTSTIASSTEHATPQYRTHGHQHSLISSTTSIFSSSSAKTPDSVYSVSSHGHLSSQISTEYTSAQHYSHVNGLVFPAVEHLGSPSSKVLHPTRKPNYAKNIANVSCLFLFNDHLTLHMLCSRASQLSVWTKETLIAGIGLSDHTFPTTDYDKFVKNMLDNKNLPATKVALALYYILKLKEGISTTKVAGINIKGKEKLYLTVAMILASKYLDDGRNQTKDWVSVSGFSLQELNDAEHNFLSAIDYKLFMSCDEICSWKHHGLLTWLQIQAFADTQLRVNKTLLEIPLPVSCSLAPPEAAEPTATTTEAPRSSLKRSVDDTSEIPDDLLPSKRVKTWGASQILVPLRDAGSRSAKVEKKINLDKKLSIRDIVQPTEPISTSTPVTLGISLLGAPLVIPTVVPPKHVEVQLEPQQLFPTQTPPFLLVNVSQDLPFSVSTAASGGPENSAAFGMRYCQNVFGQSVFRPVIVPASTSTPSTPEKTGP